MDLIRVLHPAQSPAQAPREWLVANGLGGYACGTLSGPPIRRYHGWLIAALSPPLGRTILVSRLEQTVHLADGSSFDLDDADLAEFRLEWGLPVWRFHRDGVDIERRLVMEHGRNVSHLRWRVLAGAVRGMVLRPWMQPRPHGTPVDAAPAVGTAEATQCGLSVRCPGFPVVTLSAPGAVSTVDHRDRIQYYANEDEGGDPPNGPLFSPGTLALDLDTASQLIIATDIPADGDPWQAETTRRQALVQAAHPALRQGMAAELVLAADSFVIQPRHRTLDPTARSIVAGYHWFADWGRDTMIALEGLTLLTGRADDAKPILAGFAAHMRDGLIPNMFPDGATDGLYNTADASLWFFHAVDRVVAACGDLDFLRRLMPVLETMLEAHVKGTRFGIGMDPEDGLMRQGEDGLQLTWMDAKVEDWVVTPRRGKAVEINALWYNALCCMAHWRALLGHDGRDCRDWAERVRQSFNRRFWSDALGYLRDVVDGPDGDDGTFRPNQLFAVSLPHPVLETRHWPTMMPTIRKALLTPYGLRSLPPDHPDYKPRFEGDRWGRDGAYHQGTVWAWLIGPFAESWLKAFPDDGARVMADLDAFAPHLDQFGLGSIAEVFDADPPHRPRGCVSQAWSVAEWLRSRALCAP
ncbi:MAG: glycogen debranching enzyme family protein [Magnetospirillum gryphiswaldense]|nr:glycogen debranching enzyme family protein [Magnetospirillum gryphiswaldense]